MLQNIDLNQIKQYNASLKQYKDKAASLNAEIEYTNKELDSLCVELTAELGVQVTRENIEQIYNEQVAKINSTLQSGNAVLAKIASEEQNLASGQQATAGTMASSAAVAGVAPQAQAVSQVPPVPTAPVPPVGTQPMFNQQINATIDTSVNTVLPPMFN